MKNIAWFLISLGKLEFHKKKVDMSTEIGNIIEHESCEQNEFDIHFQDVTEFYYLHNLWNAAQKRTMEKICVLKSPSMYLTVCNQF